MLHQLIDGVQHRYHRIEVLAALASVLCSWAVTGILVAEAVHRIMNPTPVDGKLMFFLALAGIATAMAAVATAMRMGTVMMGMITAT